MNYYKHHIFFCLNQREDGEACCSDKGAENMFMYMKSKIKSFDLNGESNITDASLRCICSICELLENAALPTTNFISRKIIIIHSLS